MELNKQKKQTRLERGLSMLEYAAAAAVLMTIIYVGLSAFGNGISNFYSNLGNWATNATLPDPASYP